MVTEVSKTPENKSEAVAGQAAQKTAQGVQFEDNRPEAVSQRKQAEAMGSKSAAGTGVMSKAVSMELVHNAASFSTSYAIAIIKKELYANVTVKNAFLTALYFGLNSLISLPVWVNHLKQAYGVLKAVAGIPRGVVAVFLWAIGKGFMLFAEKFYNKGKLAYFLGDVTEAKIYTLLHAADGSHESVLAFVTYVEKISLLIITKQKEGDGAAQEHKEGKDTAGKEKKEVHSPSFLSLHVETPELTNWSDKDGALRAGLNAKANAHLSLLGQTMGGDVDVKLPFGEGWKITVDNFFKSSSFSLPGFKVGNISGDSLEFNDSGLVSASMSVNDLVVNGDVVKVSRLSVTYHRGGDELLFEGAGSVELWNDKRLNGNLELALGTNGAFQRAAIKLSSTGAFDVIPGYLFIVDPGGSVKIYKDKVPDMDVHTGIRVENLPGGATVKGHGGIQYMGGELGGYINSLNFMFPIGKHAKLMISLIEAKFNAEEVTAENASIHFDYDKNVVDQEHTQPGAEAQSILTGDLSWLDVSQFVDLEKLSVHRGAKNLSLKGGKFSHTKDEKNGLQVLKAKVLGVAADYNAPEKKGSLKGEVEKKIDATLLRIDFPIVGFAGAYVEMEGFMNFGAALSVQLAKNEAKSNSSVTAINLEGEVGAHAGAGLKLNAGAFVGIANLASLKGGLFGLIRGEVTGKMAMNGGVLYNNDQAKIKSDKEAVPKGAFSLTGVLMAEVGGELKAQVLVFEKKIASVVIGNWVIGSYKLAGDMIAGKGGVPKFVVTENGFVAKPRSPKTVVKPLSLEDWLDKVTAGGKKLDYGADADKQLSKIARDIVYGAFTPEKKGEFERKYLALLNDGDQTKFRNKLAEINEMRSHNGTNSYIWSAAMWNKAVNRKKILGFEQSRSKAAISDLIGAYHLIGPKLYEERLTNLTAIENVIVEYVDHRSKVAENKNEADLLLEQIHQERKKIAAEIRSEV